MILLSYKGHFLDIVCKVQEMQGKFRRDSHNEGKKKKNMKHHNLFWEQWIK